MVCLVINAKIYFPDGEVAGIVIDLIFKRDGKIVAIIASKMVIPVFKMGLINIVLPYNMVRKIKGKYHVLLPKSLLFDKRLLSTYLDPRIVVSAFRYKLKRIMIVIAYILIAILLLVLSLMFRKIGAIIYLIAVGLLFSMPLVFEAFLIIKVPGYYNLSLLRNSKVYDANGYLIGIVADAEIDYTNGIVKKIIIVKPPKFSTEFIERIYSYKSEVGVRPDLIEKFGARRVYLRISYKELF